MTATARLIVCEVGNKWAVALRRQLSSELRECLVETRSLAGCWERAEQAPEGVVILELTLANLERCASELLRFRTRLPQLPVMVVGKRSLAPAGPLMRELGAVYSVFSTRDLSSLVGIIQRHWRRVNDAENAPPWQRLPWGGTEDQQPGAGQLAEPDWLA